MVRQEIYYLPYRLPASSVKLFSLLNRNGGGILKKRAKPLLDTLFGLIEVNEFRLYCYILLYHCQTYFIPIYSLLFCISLSPYSSKSLVCSGEIFFDSR